MKQVFVGFMLFVTMIGSGISFAPSVSAACNDTLLAIPAWYRGLQDTSSCEIKMPMTKDPQTNENKPDIVKLAMTIGLNIIQGALVLVAYVTIFFIIKGGFLYLKSAGSSDGMSSAKKTITNALIGLVIAAFAASIVNAVAGVIK